LLIGVTYVADDARAANELCGQTITSNTTLTADQSCDATGLVVGADGVTIDLNGFTLSGDRNPGHFGIDVNGHSRVTIRNGIIRHFDAGIRSLDFTSQAVKVTNVTSRDNGGFGAMIVGCGITVTHSLFVTNSESGL